MAPSNFAHRSRFGAKVAAVSALALAAAACSSADRISSNPFENPFSGSGGTQTASISQQPQPQHQQMAIGQPITPSGSVTSEPLPPPGGSAYVPQSSAVPYAQSSGPMTTGTITPRPATSGRSGWTAQGGSTVVVQQGDTAASIAQRYGVPQKALLEANNIPQGSALMPGQRVSIPVFRSGGSASAGGAMASQPNLDRPAATMQVPSASRPQTAARGGAHTVEAGETLYSVARRYQVAPGALAAANGLTLDHRVRVGERLSLPGGAAPSTAVAQRPKPAETAAPQQTAALAAPKTIEPAKPVEAAPQVTKVVAKPETAPAQAAAARAEEAEETGSASSSEASFRWPVRGRVISGFGSKPNGSSNEGINLAVPEGTPVKASEGGVVAYAGNELKGYGNLVLVRHSGGWVTAYAHASEIMVKRGDVVRRGQVIAKSGKSGNVTSPQLHFEVRRGATPVDPMDHLPQG
jgi:murein DD-endopeptidase MepM/ murein hydrolase activator NlpD